MPRPRLHQTINAKFRTDGISIAFPQHDVHLRTADPLDVRVHQVRQDVADRSPVTDDSVGNVRALKK